ncbi:MAG TPA: trypsin-like peptidase domain-containing protein [Asanoa sp.]
MTDVMSRPQHATTYGTPVPPAWHQPPYADGPAGPPPQDPFGQGAGAKPPHRHRGRRVAAIVAAGVLALGSGTAGGAVAYSLSDKPATTATSATAATSVSAPTVAAGSLSAVVDKVTPSVVTIFVPQASGTAEGSGVILSSDGKVLTNNHVVEGAAGQITVQLSDGRKVDADVLKTDSSHDLALLQLKGVSELTAATLGDSSTLQVGDTVLAFGSPLGLTGTVTSGIVSALNRDASDLGQTGLIQTDAPINSGNSGGPLVDTAGRVVGIDNANATTSQNGGSIGIGFAIPINTAIQTILS